MSLLEQAILKTLIYADVFDYPLTLDELWERMVEVRSTKLEVRSASKKIKNIVLQNGFYSIRGRASNRNIRERRGRSSLVKMFIARRAASVLSFLPMIKLIGVSGALACENVDETDDIDLFIVTSSGLIWTTRFLSVVLLEIFGMRRRPNDRDVNDTICLNMFVDEKHMKLPWNEQDVYGAYEVTLMKPIFSRGDIYQRFLRQNDWATKYLPNSYSHSVILAKLVLDSDRGAGIHSGIKTLDSRLRGNDKQTIWFRTNPIERFFKVLQLLYMRRRRTTEVVEEGRIRFHPKDARKWVLKEYRRRVTIQALVVQKVSGDPFVR